MIDQLNSCNSTQLQLVFITTKKKIITLVRLMYCRLSLQNLISWYHCGEMRKSMNLSNTQINANMHTMIMNSLANRGFPLQLARC